MNFQNFMWRWRCGLFLFEVSTSLGQHACVSKRIPCCSLLVWTILFISAIYKIFSRNDAGFLVTLLRVDLPCTASTHWLIWILGFKSYIIMGYFFVASCPFSACVCLKMVDLYCYHVSLFLFSNIACVQYFTTVFSKRFI